MLTTFFFSKRLASLYSDFRYQRTTNPDGYAANIAAWEAMLQKAVQAGKIPGGNSILALKTGPELSRALETKEWGRPLALDTVVVGGQRCGPGSELVILTWLTNRTSLFALAI